MKSGSNLEKVFESGQFAVTGELGPPTGPDTEAIRKKVEVLRGVVDAMNVTENQSAMVRMSSMAVSAFLVREGVEPIMQMTCRDRNRIAMQSDLIGAAALGIRNLTCVTGDHPCFGNQKGAKKVFDLDSTQLISMVRQVRDERRILGGEKEIPGEAPMLIGSAANPFGRPLEYRALLLAKKVRAGADYVQTQAIFDIPRFEEWMAEIRNLGLHHKVRVLAGVMPLKTIGMVNYMLAKVPGISIPDEVVRRMASAPKGKAGEVGMRICQETIERIRGIEGVSGIHVMAIEWEHRVREIVEAAGLLPRPVL